MAVAPIGVAGVGGLVAVGHFVTADDVIVGYVFTVGLAAEVAGGLRVFVGKTGIVFVGLGNGV